MTVRELREALNRFHRERMVYAETPDGEVHEIEAAEADPYDPNIIVIKFNPKAAEV